MNKLKTTDYGKFPFYLDDLRWIDDGIREAFGGLINSLGEDKYIISGCELTYNPVTVKYECAEGFIAWSGEILYCPGGEALSDENVTAVFDLDVDYDPDPPSLRTFGNEEDKMVYEIRRAEYKSVASGSTGGKLIALTAKRLPQLIGDLISGSEEDWHYPGDAGEVALQGAWESVNSGALSKIGFKKDMFGKVWLRGQAQEGTGVVFYLPSGYRPPRKMYFSSIHPTEGTVAKITVLDDGTVGLYGGSGSEINLDGIIFDTV